MEHGSDPAPPIHEPASLELIHHPSSTPYTRFQLFLCWTCLSNYKRTFQSLQSTKSCLSILVVVISCDNVICYTRLQFCGLLGGRSISSSKSQPSLPSLYNFVRPDLPSIRLVQLDIISVISTSGRIIILALSQPSAQLLPP